MVQSANYAAMKDAQIYPNEEEYAEDMGLMAILSTNLLHLLYHIDQHTTKRLQLFLIILLPQFLPEHGGDPPSVIVCQVIDYVEV